MKKIVFSIGILTSGWLSSCNTENRSDSQKMENQTNTSNTDSSTTNPINSEYGTPNASENTTDSTELHDPNE